MDPKKAQAAVELAVFGAILIFLLGTIVRSAVGNGYAQNTNFKAMRMAMLASWKGTELSQGQGATANTSRNYASVLFVEDRLSPDFNKYGDLDRNPFIAQGSGTFTYNLLYPISDSQDIYASLPMMDVYINGQHFPFTTAFYTSKTISRPTSCTYGNSCLQNQCLRQQREWAGGIVSANQFDNSVQGVAVNDTTLQAYGSAVFNALVTQGYIAVQAAGATSGSVSGTLLPSTFSITDPVTNQPSQLTQGEINNIESILQSDQNQYPLFYQMVANGTPQFSPTAPASCGTNNALCQSLQVLDASGGTYTNTNGDMQYDLSRTGNYAAVEQEFPSGLQSCSAIGVGAYPPNMRCYIAWQWAATPGTTMASIGLVPANNEYPSYDIDGRLKMVTIYAITQNPDGTPHVTYVDNQGGDIDGTWDLTSCGPKPGLQNNSQIYTFTKNAQNGTNGGTYLQILEGKLYNPETDQFVRSASKRDTIDLVQRSIQLSNNTYRFCSSDGHICNGSDGVDCASPNPVEVCVPVGSSGNCFSGNNSLGQIIAQTCFDENDNMLFVRSRLEDQRGKYWMTDTSGQLKVQ